MARLPLSAHFDAADGLTIMSSSGQPLLTGGYANLQFSNNVRIGTNASTAHAEQDGHILTVRNGGDKHWPLLEWRIESLPQGLRLTLTITNTSSEALLLERLHVLLAPEGYNAIPFEQLRVMRNGWMTFSFAALESQAAVPDQASVPPQYAPIIPGAHPEQVLLPWVTLLNEPGGKPLLVGFGTARNYLGLMNVRPSANGHRLSAANHLENQRLAPGGTLTSEPLWLMHGADRDTLLGRYGDEVARSMKARPTTKAVRGWCSWYSYFEHISDQKILQNASWLAENRHEVPVEYVQIDDGYIQDTFQDHYGDWLDINKKKFPQGLAKVASSIRKLGFKPGIWLAPFFVSRPSRLYAEHPDWVVRDDQNEPLNINIHGDLYRSFPIYALDTTHPRAMAWLEEVIQTLVHDWGFDYLKLDFLYTAGTRGRRYDATATSVQAYHRGMELVRRVAGDKFILGSGAIFLPSVGYLDAARIGPDIFVGGDTKTGRWLTPDNPLPRNAASSIAAHAWMNRRLWINDTDPYCLRGRATELDMNWTRIQTELTSLALSGGAMVLGDDLPRLEPDRQAMLGRLLPPSEQTALPVGTFTQDGRPNALKLAITRPWGTWVVAALFNHGAEPRPAMFQPAEWGIKGEYHLHDLWSDISLGIHDGRLRLTDIPAGGVTLLSAHPLSNRPQLVATSLHLLGGVVELADERWQDGQLAVHLRQPGRHTGTLTLYVPASYELTDSAAARDDRLITLPVEFTDELKLSLVFARRAGVTK